MSQSNPQKLVEISQNGNINLQRRKQQMMDIGMGYKGNRRSKVVSRIVAAANVFGPATLIKGLRYAEDFMTIDDLKFFLQCFNVNLSLKEERELREYLIFKEAVSTQGSGNFLQHNIKIDSYQLSKILKKEILNDNPRAIFTSLSKPPTDIIKFLGSIKDDLLNSCLQDLEQVRFLKIFSNFFQNLLQFSDNSGHVSEMKIKEAFLHVFPNFGIEKVDHLISILYKRKKPTQQNLYQEKFAFEEIMIKIQEGDKFKTDDAETLVVNERLIQQKERFIKEEIDQKNGKFLEFGECVAEVAEKPESLDNLVRKMKNLLTTLKRNEEFQKKVVKGFDEKLIKKDDSNLPLTLPIIKFCLIEDFNSQGTLPILNFVQLIIDTFPTIERQDAFQMARLGEVEGVKGIVDYMISCKQVEKLVRKMIVEENKVQ